MKNNVVCITNSNIVEISSVKEPLDWCLNSLIAPVYFIVFVLIAQLILMNIVIAVLMKQIQVRNLQYN